MAQDHEGPPTGGRFPRHVYGVGTEPDPRFSLANERTFLAWLRTGLAMMAAGVALHAFELPMAPVTRDAASLLLLGLGIMASGNGWLSWAKAERALRQRRQLPGPVGGLALAIGTCVAGAVVVIGLVLA